MAELAAIVDGVVGRARHGEQIEALAVDALSTDVRVYEGEIEQLATAGTQGVGIRVIVDGRQGFAWAGTLEESVVAETLDAARDNASFGEPDEHAGLAEPDDVEPADIDLFRPGLAGVPTQDKIDLALRLERAVKDGDPRISGLESCDYGDAVTRSALATTTGLCGEVEATAASLSAYSMASDGNETQTGFGFTVGREFADLDLDEAARDAVERATRMLGAAKPPSERLTVVLDPFVTARFLGIISSTLSGESVLKGRSLFADRLGDAVAAPTVTLVDDPTDTRAWGATPFDDEGLAARRNVLIGDGRLERFVHNAYTGRKAGAASTGSAVRGGFKSTPTSGCHAVALIPGDRSPADLVAEVDNGVLVQSVSGLHSGVNPVSGDFSTGADGIRIRDGELAEPVREFTIASTLQRMLRDVIAVGNDQTWLPMRAAGITLVIGDVTVSGS